MATYFVKTKAGNKGPFTLRVIQRGLEVGKIPPSATLVERETGQELTASQLIHTAHSTTEAGEDSAAADPLPLSLVDPHPLPAPINGLRQSDAPGDHASAARQQPQIAGRAVLLIGLGLFLVAATVFASYLAFGREASSPAQQTGSSPTSTGPGNGESDAVAPRSEQGTTTGSEATDPTAAPDSTTADNLDQPAPDEEEEEIRPWEVHEYTGMFRNNELAAKQELIGKRVALTGYLTPYENYFGRRGPDVYLSTYPLDFGPDADPLHEDDRQATAGMLIVCYLANPSADMRILDTERKVVIVGRAIKPNALDGCRWEFAD